MVGGRQRGRGEVRGNRLRSCGGEGTIFPAEERERGKEGFTECGVGFTQEDNISDTDGEPGGLRGAGVLQTLSDAPRCESVREP